MRNDIHCPKDIGFENIFDGKDCEKEQFYNNCYHCWSSAIAKKCQQERQLYVLDQKPCKDCTNLKKVKELLDEYYAELTLDEKALESNAKAIKVVRHIINDIESL